jgi:monomeric isocitrate dehydrogenase
MKTSLTYAIANKVVGFATSSIRVQVVRYMSASQVEVLTADLSDAGTWLVLNPNQLTDLHS